MKKLRIGVFPFSNDLSHPADRRRILPWAKARGHELVIGETRDVDAIYLSEQSDFVSLSKLKGPPKVFDLIDGYLAETGLSKDLARGSLKSIMRMHRTLPGSFTKFLKVACRNVDAVVCSSPEQSLLLRNLNNNVYEILDNHEEFPILHPKIVNTRDILWEGQTHTIKPLLSLLKTQDFGSTKVNAITDELHYRLLGRYFPKSLTKILSQKDLLGSMRIWSWSVENVVQAAKSSALAIVPLNLKDPLHYLKPENRLLIMMRLGLPCLVSATPAHIRVEKELGVNVVCRSNEEWLEKIAQLQDSCELRTYYVELGKNYVLQRHNLELNYMKWDKVFSRIT